MAPNRRRGQTAPLIDESPSTEGTANQQPPRLAEVEEEDEPHPPRWQNEDELPSDDESSRSPSPASEHEERQETQLPLRGSQTQNRCLAGSDCDLDRRLTEAINLIAQNLAILT